ncbi:MAG TPA: autotransporter domain-containing protein [Rhodanobacteraceae bacterium]|nr:autotransporter domain-containing protein [Rhodanobacteraceae bacterium]
MTTTTKTLSILFVAIANGLLAGCGGGGSSVRAVPESAPPDPPPPPSSAPAEPCPPPVTGDCVADVPSSAGNQDMTGGRSSDHALIKRGDGQLTLASHSSNDDLPPTVDFRFGGGTTIENGALRVWSNATLHSDVVVQTAGTLQSFGTITGSLDNHGYTLMWDKVVGDVANDGVLEPGSSIYGDVVPARVEGNLRQTPNGTLIAVIGVGASLGALTGGFLTVTGRADIDGTLRLVQYADDFGPYPLPGAPLSLQVLHADGGVFGQFAQWTSPGLFVTGAPRYLANDVYFDITAISAATTMAAAKADALTVRSAAHFDAALDNAGKWANRPDASFSATQRQFLASVGAVQHLQDYGQATRTLDSLSGQGYAAATDTLLRQASLPNADLMARMDSLHPGSRLGAWSGQSTLLASGAGAFNDQRAGFDQWLDDRTLFGSSFAWSDGSLRFDRSGGVARDQSPQWDVYVQRLGRDDTYLFGDIGYSRHELRADRQIDLGIGQRSVRARQDLDLLRSYFEAGRNFHIGGGRLTLFGAVSHVMLHGAGFIEQGATGFELAVQPSTYQRASATAGLRIGQDWHTNSGRWTSVNLAAGYLQTLRARDDAQAAFTGTPDVRFALDGMQQGRNTGWLHLNLGTGNEHWTWLLSYDRQASDEALSLGAKLGF